MVVAALAGGSYVFLGVVLAFVAATIFGLYTRTGSGITERPYGKVHGGAPGAFGAGSVSGHDGREHDWTRGTR